MKGIYARRPIICVPLTPPQKGARERWRRQHVAWIPDEWSRVMFTDESRFSLNSYYRRVFVWREAMIIMQFDFALTNARAPFGRQNVHDDERSGRPVTATDNAAVAAVRNVVEADRRVTIDEIIIRLPPGIEIRRSSIGTIMSDGLNFRKVCARWVPRFLSENHKQQRMEAARAFREMHQRDGDQLFSRIVTGDESWVHHSTPETKRQSMVWKKPEESAPKKTKAARYCEVLTKLKAAIKRKRPGLLSRKVLLVHDNARPHAARTTQTLLENFKWKIFTHPTYSPDLAPSDFHLFPALKLHLEGKHFANDDEVQAEANHWLRRQDTVWYNSGIKKLLQRYQKCLNRNGDYVE
ncbi:hypothetical protein LAZ67_4001298 [Cordylochernes scorpioides]|uniref:Transposase n=1 Tax=Cordylochernes scorpioides TaxID=51811 RepID=A0ABY6KBU9_9ARAC|nr:hypothetical protein LAZ67_4001298 [Cordylochernes scorpioides]